MVFLTAPRDSRLCGADARLTSDAGEMPVTGKSRDMLVALALLVVIALLLPLLSPVQVIRQGADTLRTTISAFRERPATVSRDPISRQPSVDRAGAPALGAPAAPLAGQRAATPALGAPAWITSDDYPAEALRNNWQGRTSISWTIDETGRATDCIVLESSGHAVLDEASCRLVLNRARYIPALDEQGRPAPSRDYRRIVWRLPE